MRSGVVLAWLFASGVAQAALAPPVPGPPRQPSSTLEWRAYRSFTSAEGLPQNSVLALLQDSDGFVYAGTNHGLARYDGRGWQEVALPTGEQSYAVGALTQAADGALWIGTDTVGAWRLHDGQAQRAAAEAITVYGFWSGPDGRVWIAAEEGLMRCAALQCARIAASAGPTRSLLGEEVDGVWRLWVGTGNEGVIQLQDLASDAPARTGLQIGPDQGLPNRVGISLARFDGDLWIGSGRGLARYDGTRLTTYDARNGFPPAMVFALLPDRDAAGEPVLLASLRPGGLAEVRADGQWRVIDSQHGLPSNAVHSLLRERNRDALWLGTMNAGIARVERQRWTVFDERTGLPDRIVVGVGWSAPTSTLWAGTAGGAAHWRDGRFVPLLPPAYNEQEVYDLIDAPDGARWIAHSRGLQRWRGDTLEADHNIDDPVLPAVSVDRLALRRIDGGYELYAATGHGLVRWRADTGLVDITLEAGLEDGAAVRGIAVLPDAQNPDGEAVWVASDTRLQRMDARGVWQAHALPCAERVATLGFAAETGAAGDTLWLATRNGLRRRDPGGRCVPYPATRALGALTHVRLSGDQVYVFGARGAMRLARAEGPDQAGYVYDAAAGLTRPEIAASAVDDRGRVYGATAAGLVALQPELVAPAAPAPLRLLAARRGTALQPLAEGAVLPPDDSGVRFDFSLLAFDREHLSRYRTRLLGLDARYGAWSADAFAAYPRLPPGAYRLQVQAQDADGVAAAPVEFAFSVAAHWWQRPITILAAALLLLASGLGVGRWRLQAARHRAAALEAEVAQRTRELAAANARLEQAAVTDPLTGLKNRRYFALAAAAEAERARRLPPSVAMLVVLLDIDHFKRINDAYGHEAGDAVLSEVARRLEGLARAGDIVLRWGGEEFLLLLRDIEREGAPALLHRLLHALAAEPIVTVTHSIAITASLGAIRFPPDPSLPQGTTLEQAMARADAALYRAKGQGRDRAMLIEPTEDEDAPNYVSVRRT